MSRGVKDLKTLVDENRKALEFTDTSAAYEKTELLSKV